MPELRVRRDELETCALVDVPSPVDLEDGEALLLVERFALTTNNISYARLGDQLGYWQVFPADGGWGRIPAWGYSRVVASRSPDLAEGRRFFGLVPMGTHLTVRPVARGNGFADAVPHRAGLAPLYNLYFPITDAESDAALVMRPLFGTSVVLDLLLTAAEFDGADTVVLTSASSKTAYGLAYLLKSRPVTVIGLTSTARREWLTDLGLYDIVIGYHDVDSLAAPGGAVLVDVAGDEGVLRQVHERLGGSLVRSIRVGFTRGQAPPDDETLPGPTPEFFFAPDEMARWRAEFGHRYAEAWQGFAPVAETTMRIVTISDADQLPRVYEDLVAGRVDPALGFVVTLTAGRGAMP